MTTGDQSIRFQTNSCWQAGTTLPLPMHFGWFWERPFTECTNPQAYKNILLTRKPSLLSVDCLGFRRGQDGLSTILKENDLENHPLLAQAKIRGIRALAGHSESTDLTNDVNGGPSGIGIATAAGKAAFWELVGAGESPKIIAVEGEFAMTSGHSQEMKTQAVAQQVGKRLRIFLSFNNSGIDDECSPPATIINAAGTKIRETAPSAPRSASRINTAVARRRYGKRALRIPLDSAFLGGGSGANIP